MQVDPLLVLKKLASSYDIKCLRVAAPFTGLEDFDYGLRKALDPQFEWQEFGKLLIQSTAENVLTITEDMFELQYALFRIPDGPESVFLMGPWTSGTRTNETSEWIRKHIGKEACEVVQNYYSSVRVVQDNRFISTISTIVGLMMPPDEYRVVEKREFLPLNFALDTRFFQEPSFEQELPQTMLEERYATENKLFDAVSRGDVDAAINICHQMGRYTYNGRFCGTLYQIKTKMTIMNTLMRKAIERGKVHPYYIDKISSRYAAQIESMTDLNDPSMIWDMVHQYCAYVQRYSVKDYTPLVQKVINHINLNLAEPMSLKSLAAMCFISPSYLSSLFKQDTGTTIVDYINTQRVDRAAVLLATTDRSIAAVAAAVGILDVNYFTKIFKKQLGTTPTQYRREKKATLNG